MSPTEGPGDLDELLSLRNPAQADPPTDPNLTAPTVGSLTPTAEFILQRYRPVYNYASNIVVLGRTVYATSLVVAIIGGIIGMMGAASGGMEAPVVLGMAVIFSGLTLAFGFLFKTVAEVSASALRVFADTAVGAAPLADADKLMILKATTTTEVANPAVAAELGSPPVTR